MINLERLYNYDKIEYADNNRIDELRYFYTIIDVKSLDSKIIKSHLLQSEIKDDICKKKMIYDMLNYYNKDIYKKTNYFCSDQQSLCICNKTADDLKEGLKSISWFRQEPC